MPTFLGIVPWGLDPPTAAPIPPAGSSTLSRYINPGSGDYEIDSDTGHFKTMPVVRQRVLLAVKTKRGSSSALQKLGTKLPGKLDKTFDAQVRAEVRRALRVMIETEKVLLLRNVTIERTTLGRAYILISYLDLTTGLLDQAEL